MSKVLKQHYGTLLPEAGCDEAGRGCLAGPVTAAAVILPEQLLPELKEKLQDSKQLSAAARSSLNVLIKENAIAYAVASIDHHTIDAINILRASIRAMHSALQQLSLQPACILADGRHFEPYGNIPHVCVVKGDATYLSIAAASILAKVHRDELMTALHRKHPEYDWMNNKGYPTPAHRRAILTHGLSPYHRKSFKTAIQHKMTL